MAHEDQFTATGPAFTGAGFPRAAFSTGRGGTDSTYGVNVQGSECGVYGESLSTPENESPRTASQGTGVYGKGENYGVKGEGRNGGIFGWVLDTGSPGVLGSSFVDGPGVAGFSQSVQESDFLGTGIGVIGASNRGTGVVGLSLKKIDLRDVSQGGGAIVPNQDTEADGEGTGVLGASRDGSGIKGQSIDGSGVMGTSHNGAGAFLTSEFGDAVVGITGGPGNGVRGTANSGSGVLGESNTGIGVSGSSTTTFGVFGDSAKQSGVVGRSRGNTAPGVFGNCQDFTGVAGRSTTAPGVYGESVNQAGVLGKSTSSAGVFGFGDAAFQAPFPPVGVLGINDKSVGVLGSSLKVIGVLGTTDTGLGVIGQANSGLGVPLDHITDNGIGVTGLGNAGFGVAGLSAAGTGVYGSSQTGLAGHFKGTVLIEGALTVVGGNKSAAVPHPDGSHRQLYCMESPESWFEDFGEEQLVQGKAEVQLDPGFAALVEIDGYHIFLTPYGESNGMFVAERHETGFRVSEQQGGKSNVSFAYRVVAKRKGVTAARLAKVTLPETLRGHAFPDLGFKIGLPDFERLSVNPLDLPDVEPYQ